MSISDCLGYIFSLLPKLWRWLSTWKFKRIFGRDAGEEYRIVYNLKTVPEGIVFSHPKPKLKRRNYRRTKSLTTINSCATTRAIGHLVYAFGEKVDKPPIISSDFDIDIKMDLSFISIGGLTNLKTCDLLNNPSNHFLDFGSSGVIHRGSKRSIIDFSRDVAYGFIIKLNPHNNPERTWICCAGFEEWGTRGAAWFLAHKWKDICKWAKYKPFAIITKTDYNSDESTELVHRFLTSEEVEEFSRNGILS